MRALAFIVALIALALPSKAVAVSPIDPPLTYLLTVYDRDPDNLAPDGTTVFLSRSTRELQRLGLPLMQEPCGKATVVGGRAEMRVDITTACPEGMVAFFGLILPEVAIGASSEPRLEWRRAYSESTMTVRLVIRPEPPRS
jgi:hypothetical protein